MVTVRCNRTEIAARLQRTHFAASPISRLQDHLRGRVRVHPGSPIELRAHHALGDEAHPLVEGRRVGVRP